MASVTAGMLTWPRAIVAWACSGGVPVPAALGSHTGTGAKGPRTRGGKQVRSPHFAPGYGAGVDGGL